jgi:hypothetical protein
MAKDSIACCSARKRGEIPMVTDKKNKTMGNNDSIRFVLAGEKNGYHPTATRNHTRFTGLILMIVVVLFPGLVSGTGLNWPANQSGGLGEHRDGDRGSTRIV